MHSIWRITDVSGSDKPRQYLLFRLGSEEYGLPIAKVSSLIRYEPATPIPRAPAIVEGVINLRGRVIPVVNLGRKFFDADFAPTAASRIIVAEGDGGLVGLMVDEANEVMSVMDDAILPAPEAVLTRETAEAFEGVVRYDGRLIVLLDLDRALPHVDYESSSDEDIMEGDEDV